MQNLSTQRPVSLFSTLAVKKALDGVVRVAFTHETGIAVDTVYEPTNLLLARIAAGARPDVLIGVTHQLEPLGPTGVVDLSTRVSVATVRVGIAVGAELPCPDISTVKALTLALTGARSVAYSRSGASGVYFAGLLQRLGIAEQVNARATIIDTGFTAEAVVDGRADIAVQLLSEHRSVPDATIVGPLPDEVQQITEFSAVLGRAGAVRPENQALMRYLIGSRAQEAYLNAGMEIAQTSATT
ncbi:substrate-binding domain-containing protein [Arthrobacter ruber]|uniref:substrate-binding domain-containing protein n=1 Tax=Arthrobacter ruber TaxID=1258893 RepID=UPI000CF50DD3|nr:substrate-binding domain-containing protein [Arthrobacter ruber]